MIAPAASQKQSAHSDSLACSLRKNDLPSGGSIATHGVSGATTEREITFSLATATAGSSAKVSENTPATMYWVRATNGRIEEASDPSDRPGGDNTGNFFSVMARVWMLPVTDGADGPGLATVTRTVRLLFAAYHLVGSPFPLASASTTDAGGIHVYWKRPGRYLKLSVSSGSQDHSYVYYQDGQTSHVARGITPRVLADWIRHFAGE